MASTSSSFREVAETRRMHLPDADRQAVLCPKYGQATLQVCEKCEWHEGYIPVAGNERAPHQERYRVFCHHFVKRLLRPVFGLSHPVVTCPLIRIGGRMGTRDPFECQGCKFFRGYVRRPANRVQRMLRLGAPAVACAHATARRFDPVA